MKKVYSIILMLTMMIAALSITACGNKQKDNNNEKTTEAITESDDADNSEQDIKFIKEWYDYVFGTKEISDNILNQFLSQESKKRLWTDDYDGTYEYWRFRTTAQDSNSEVGDISKIEDISVNGDGWYEVTYLDMGNKGKTKVRIENNKITDFVQDSSWDSWDAPVDDAPSGNNDGDYKQKAIQYMSDLQEIAMEIDDVYNQYVSLVSSGNLDPMTHGNFEIKATQSMNKLRSKAESIWDKLIVLARENGGDVRALQDEKKKYLGEAYKKQMSLHSVGMNVDY